MGLVDDANKAAQTHVQQITSRLDLMCTLLTRFNEQVSDLGRPDTGDIKHRLVRKQKYTAGEPASVNRIGEPRGHEYWMIQAIIVNGLPNKSPAFVLRTSIGALLASVVKEGMGSEPINGDLIVMPGEEIFIEPEETGTFDFTIYLVRRKLPGRYADAGAGVSGEAFDYRARGEHEPGRDFPEQFEENGAVAQ